jgi:hypothetical protein
MICALCSAATPPYSYANPIVAPAGGPGPLCGVTLASDLRGRGGGSLGKVLGPEFGQKITPRCIKGEPQTPRSL